MNKSIAQTWSGFQQEYSPVVGIELTDTGWRGVTDDGEILDVQSAAGVPDNSILQMKDGVPVGYRGVHKKWVSVTSYENCFKLACELHRDNQHIWALNKIDQALSIVPTKRARFNRAMILLALGRWAEGFEEFEICEREPPFIRPNAQAALDVGGIPWQGEPLEGKRLLILHDHGFGDTIMMLRFIERLQPMCAGLSLAVPQELRAIAGQFGDVLFDEPCDYFTSFLHLMHWLKIDKASIPTAPYIKVRPNIHARGSQRKRIGVAWSVGIDDKNDFPRSLPLEDIIARYPNAELHSLQKQGKDKAIDLDVCPHEFESFSDVAELMMNMDEIVTVDTAAAHLAGAIGHPNVTVLLSKWHSWRWKGNPFYPNIHIEQSGR